MIGKKLAQYEIIEELGQGGMATVYRAYQPRMDRYVAVKVIRQAIIEDTNARQRFQREARIIARLEHPHLLPIYDFDGSHDPPYIVMRYLEGGTLKNALAGRRLPFNEITYLLRQVGSALDYAHRQGVIHRDIKPSNIMIDKEGNAFVMDFGIARMTGRDSADGGLTGTGTIIGTPDYMAPEQGFGSAEVDLRADVYSLGVLLFEMTTGQLPFRGKTPMETMLHHLSKEVPSINEINSQIPKDLDKVTNTAMAKDPADRYPSVVEFIAEVIGVLGLETSSTPNTLQEAAQESVELIGIRRAELEEQIEATMAEFAAARGGIQSGTDSQATPAQQHRTVTALYADVAEYNEILEIDLGPETARRAVHDLWAQANQIVDENGGITFRQSDRDLLALWGAVSAREDDPERAVRASLAVRDSLGSRVGDLIAEDEPFPIGIGLNTGPALIAVDDDTGSFTASGATVNLASKVAGKADGLVLITQDTYRHVQGVFDIEEDRPLRVRRASGWAQTNTYQVKDAKPRAFRLQPRGVEGVNTQMVGRRAELEEIQKAYYTAVEDSETQVVTVVSAPGLGKSRLLYEFAAWTELRPEKFFIFRGRATPAMTNRPYSLWRDILSFRFEILDSDSPDVVRQKLTGGISSLIGENDELAHLMGYLAGFDMSDSPNLVGDPKEVAHRGRRAAVQFFRLLSERDPVVIQLEDLHHADEPSLDLLVEITSADADLPLLALAMARPGLYQHRPTWGSGQDFHIRIDLRPLSKRDSRELAAEILQKVDEVPRELRDLLVERAEGNPYYMEELVKMLVEDRVIQKVDQDLWTVETSRLRDLRVPPTLVSLLQARFDSLLYPEKLTLQRAAVVGRVFYDTAVSALDAADQTHVDDLAGILKSLTEREFVFPRETSAFEGSTEYIFGQAMMRDLILETLLEDQTLTYHKAMAQWLSLQGGQRAGEYDGLIADHYEQAGEYSLAADYLARASKAAFDVGAYQDGLKLGERALDLLANSGRGHDNVELRLKIQMSLADAHGFLGNYDFARQLLESALENARLVGDRANEAVVLAHLGRLIGAWQNDYQTGRPYLEEALEINQELDDKSGLVFILRQLGNLFSVHHNYTDAEAYLEQSLYLAREIEDIESEANALNSIIVNANETMNFEKALKLSHEALDIAGQLDDPLLGTMISGNMARAYVMMGDFAAAKPVAESAVITTTDAGSRYLLQVNLSTLGWVAIGSGQYDLARDYLHKSLILARELERKGAMTVDLCLFAWLEGHVGSVVKAFEWLGLIKTLELYNNRLDIRHLFVQIVEEIRGDLTEDEVEALMNSGAGLKLDDVVEKIIEETGKGKEES